ncbi:MAG: hypothetical protein Q9M13_01380, partial [Mariprofundales bacterium]|nr:hypothetical protein [Mariprofundales bacterium]
SSRFIPIKSIHHTMTIYQQLQQHGSPRVQLGRPMHIGINRDGTAIGALRLNLSAPLIIDAISNNHQDSLINHAMVALDRVQEEARAQGVAH